MRKSQYILREEGLGTWLSRLLRFSVVKLKRLLQDKSGNAARWVSIKDRYRGERAFLIGNGPSLNRTPMHLLRDEHCICFNRFYLMFERLAWRPRMYASVDDLVARDIAEDLETTVLPQVDLAFFPDLHPYNIDFRKFLPDEENVYWLHLDKLGFSDELPYAGLNKTVTNVALQVLSYLGFDPIYLVGVDTDYELPKSAVQLSARDVAATKDDDPNHFDPRYFGKGSHYHHPRMLETIEKYVEAKEFFDERGVRIQNAGIGGRLEVFPRVDFRSLFPRIGAEAEYTLLQEAVDRCNTVLSGGAISKLGDVSADTVGQVDGGWLSHALYSECMPDLLRTHLTFGPAPDGRYLVAKRVAGPAWQ